MPAGVSAWTPLANITLGSAQTSVVFSSINGSYRDLVLVCSFEASPTQEIFVRVNNDSSSIYNSTMAIAGMNTSKYASSQSSQTWFRPSFGTANQDGTKSSLEMQFMDYSQTDKHKTVLAKSYANIAYFSMFAGRWPSTSAITSISLFVGGGTWTFSAGSTFALYGVSA
jgi:hypothetical protein